MKKKLTFLLIPLLAVGLSSCVMYNGQAKSGQSKTPSSSASPDASVIPPNPTPHEIPDDSQEGTKITVYLVFGQYGLYEGQAVNDKEDALFLEHVKKMADMTVGSDLPGKDKVTSSVSGSEFKAWVMYKNDGKLTEYTKVPAINNAVLYASFSGGQGGGSSGGGGGSGGGGSVTPSEYTPATAEEVNGTGYGFKFFGAHETYMAGQQVDPFDGFDQYKFSMRAFKKGQEFALYDFGSQGTWTVPIDKYSFGGSSDHPTEWEKYLSRSADESRYTVLQDFNSPEIYIKIKYGQDQVYIALG